MEVIHHFAHTWGAARQGTNQVVLIAVINPHVRIGGPDEDRIDATNSVLQIVKVAIDRVFAGYRIIKISLLDHHLRLHEGRAGPLESRQSVSLGAVAYADLALCTP